MVSPSAKQRAGNGQELAGGGAGFRLLTPESLDNKLDNPNQPHKSLSCPHHKSLLCGVKHRDESSPTTVNNLWWSINYHSGKKAKKRLLRITTLSSYHCSKKVLSYCVFGCFTSCPTAVKNALQRVISSAYRITGGLWPLLNTCTVAVVSEKAPSILYRICLNWYF